MLMFWSALLLPLVQSLVCNSDREYTWPYEDRTICCKKCEPGHYFINRCRLGSSITECKSCVSGYYYDKYNIDRKCMKCTDCTKNNLVYVTPCSTTNNAVCGCDPGYECTSSPCSACVKVVATDTTTVASGKVSTSVVSVSVSAKVTPTAPALTDSVVLLLLLVCVCVFAVCVCVLLTCVVLTSRRRPAWLRSMCSSLGFWVRKKPQPASECTEEEEVALPVQEVCGKADGV